MEEKKNFNTTRNAHSQGVVGGREETTKFARSTKVPQWLRESRRAENTKRAAVKAK